jgi:uncharacterized protein with HEPN domain
MQLEARKYLHDMQRAADSLEEFTSGKSLEDYQSDALLRSAVERQFEIIGEAMSRLAKLDPQIAAQIRDYQRIIAFRNILIHGYAEVDNQIVWGVLVRNLPPLRQDVEDLLTEGESAH